jgi:glycosyltransferase involved in cell wall biosynthesis
MLADGLKERGHKVKVICCSPLLIKKCREKKIDVQKIPIFSEFDLIAAIKVAFLIKKEDIQILHLHSAHAHTIGILASLLAPTKIVVSRRVDFHLRKNPLSWLKYRIRIDKIIAVSYGVKKVLMEDGIDEEKIDVVYSGIDLNKFKNQNGAYLYDEFNLSRDSPIIGVIAALAPHKDHKNFIKAAYLIKKKVPQAKFLIVGDGPLKDELKSFTAQLNLKDSVIFTGFREDIPAFLSIFDIFLLSSYLEGFCTSLLDAQLLGVPIVATNTGGIPEIIEDGVNGLLAPPRDPTALAQAALKLIEDRALARKLAAAGKESVKKFSKERMIASTEKIYFEVING